MNSTVGVPSSKRVRWTGDWLDLLGEVVLPGLCTGCGGCVIACPHDVLDLDRPRWNPSLRAEGWFEGNAAQCSHGQRGCTLCTRACPRFRLWESDADRQMFGRARTAEEVVGISQGVYLVESTDQQIASVGQDGGFASALLIYALEHDDIDGALVGYCDDRWDTHAGVATTREEVLRAAGSRYTYTANTLAFDEAVDRGLTRLGLVGMGCQVSVPAVAGARGAPKLARKIALTVGLLCSKTFTEDIFEGLLSARYGVARHEIVKVNIKGRLQVWLDREEGDDYLEIPLREAREWTRPGCERCPDFGAEHADLSLGGIGAYAGRTLTVVRTDLGADLLMRMKRDGWIEVHDAREEDPAAVALMQKLGVAQRKRWPVAVSPSSSPCPEPAALPIPSVAATA